MRRYLALVCACVMLLCIAVSVWAADLDQRDDTVSGEDITWIGDSYSVIMEPLIIGLYPGVEIYAQGGRRFFVDQQGNSSGYSILSSLSNDGRVRPYVVFALGTCDYSLRDRAELDAWIDNVVALAPASTFIFVTPCTAKYKYPLVSQALRDSVARHANVRIAEWNSLCSSHLDEYFAEDKVHPTTEVGEAAGVSLVSEQLVPYPGIEIEDLILISDEIVITEYETENVTEDNS